jgi:hypothetical protein
LMYSYDDGAGSQVVLLNEGSIEHKACLAATAFAIAYAVDNCAREVPGVP